MSKFVAARQIYDSRTTLAEKIITMVDLGVATLILLGLVFAYRMIETAF
jgi:hypothetical protein